MKGLQIHNYGLWAAIDRLQMCQSVFGHLSNDFVLEVLNNAISWELWESADLRSEVIFKLALVMEASLMDELDANLAIHLLSYSCHLECHWNALNPWTS